MKRWTVSAAFVLLGLAMCAAPASAAPPEQREVVAGSVRVGNDGNGAFAATFDAPAPDLSYLLVVDNGCRSADPGEETPCPAPVSEISVSLNEQVVFERDDDFTRASTRLSGPISSQDNHMLVTVRGSPGFAAHIRILATPKPDARKLFDRSVRVGNDGNGASTARFDAPVRPDLTYLLVVDTGCQSCPPPVEQLTITLNEEVVFQRNGNVTHQTTRLASLNSQDNAILITAGGSPGSAARIRIIATPATEPKPKPKPPHLEVFEGTVRVGNDGNGVSAATFAAPAPDLRYALVVDNGCRSGDPGESTPCPAGVSTLTISINDQVVFQRNEDFTRGTAVIRTPIRGNDNRMLISAGGGAGSVARIRLIATEKESKPKPRPSAVELFTGTVRVGDDGNGATTARFDAPTTPNLRYFLVIDNGCRSCPPSVNELTITLNADVVFQREPDFIHDTTLIRTPVGATDNRIRITARGAAGSAAQIRIIASPR